MNATEAAAVSAIASVTRPYDRGPVPGPIPGQVLGPISGPLPGPLPVQVPRPAVGAKDVGKGSLQRTGRSLWNYIITMDVITTKATNDDHGGVQGGDPDDDHGGNDHGGGQDDNHAGSDQGGGPDDNR
ncbi:unnamed protein product [Macrosiphum euphorbiae]|uniref:Uncharacterized protein n=1 Tax=Macrosiphum euphorbiae TaxID=13131 RepID=A0AAV0WBF3_9HEMI|nr:unnamed protein product [Macrosiphum euphorbiae]